ncbi:MAG: thiamine pyrophosphate-binding protein [Alphaproteobacteria bacterium]
MSIAALADAIAKRGARRLYGVPGSGASLELIDALEGHGVGFWSTAFEGAAAIMAGTAGRMTGRAGYALSIKGPGLANQVPGLAACALEGWPMVALAEAYAPNLPPAKAHKRLDQGALVSGVAKGHRYWDGEPASLDGLASWAEREAPGPVLLELAGTIPDEPPPAPDASPSDPLAGHIAKAERPVVIAGTLAIRMDWAEQLKNLQVPVFTTAAAKGAVDEWLPHAAGVYTGVGLDLTPEKALLADADLVVGLGLRAGEVLNAAPFDCASLNLDAIHAPGADGFQFKAQGADVDATFAALAEKSWGMDEARNAVADLDATMLARPFGPAHVYRAVAGTWRDSRLVVDTGYFCTIAEHAWHAPRADLCLSSGSGRYMGIALPQSLAAADLDPTVVTVLATGDGGLPPFVAEARLAAIHELPLVVLHLSDGGYGSVRTRAINDRLTQRPLLTSGSWRATFDGFGYQTRSAHDEESMYRAMESWDPRFGPLFIDVSFDPDHYQAMVRGIR